MPIVESASATLNKEVWTPIIWSRRISGGVMAALECQQSKTIGGSAMLMRGIVLPLSKRLRLSVSCTFLLYVCLPKTQSLYSLCVQLQKIILKRRSNMLRLASCGIILIARYSKAVG